MATILLFQTSPTTPTTWICFGIFSLAFALATIYLVRRRMHFRAAMVGLGLTRLGRSLPPDFPQMGDLWHAEPKILDCYSGVYNHFDVATFRVKISLGREIAEHAAVAVKRTDWLPHRTYLGKLSVKLDTKSAPGWIVVSLQTSYPNRDEVDSLFKMLTAD